MYCQAYGMYPYYKPNPLKEKKSFVNMQKERKLHLDDFMQLILMNHA